MADLQNGSKTLSASNREVFSFIWQLLKKHPWGWSLAWGSSFLTRGLWIATAYCFKVAIDAIALGDHQNSTKWLFIAVAVYGGTQTFLILRGWSLNEVEIKTTYDASELAMESLAKKDASFYENRFSGTLSRAVSNIGGLVGQLNAAWTWDILPYIFGVTLSLVTIWRISGLIAVIIGFWSSVFVLVMYKQYTKVRKQYIEKTEDAEQHFSGIVTDTFANVQTVALFGNETFELRTFTKAAIALRKNKRNELFALVRTDASRSLMGFLMYGSVFIGMYLGWRSGMLTPGDLVFIQAQTIDVLDSSWSFSWGLGQLNKHVASIAQTLGMMKEDTYVSDKQTAKPIKIKEGTIDFEDVSFSYKSGSSALKNATIQLESGKSYALVGHSGAGKSTIVKMLLRMYDPRSGLIKIDGQDIRDVTLDSLRKSIAYVPQDPVLFHRSIADNIRYARPKATMKEVIEAAKQAQCHAFVGKLEKGYDTVVGERGAKLSGGERQRVAIARAILKNAPILLLDEATSSLDSDSELEVQRALEAVMKNRTSIIVAHRLSTIRKTDVILVVEAGHIVDQGSHEQLLARKGIYKDLWDRQSGVIG